MVQPQDSQRFYDWQVAIEARRETIKVPLGYNAMARISILFK